MNYPIYHITSADYKNPDTNGRHQFKNCLPETRQRDLICIQMPGGDIDQARVTGVAHALMSFIASGAKLCLVTFGNMMPEFLFSDISAGLELHNGSKNEKNRFEYVSLCGYADDPGSDNLVDGVDPEWMLEPRDLSPRILQVRQVSGPQASFAVTHQGACKLLGRIYPLQLMRDWEQIVQSSDLVKYQCNVPFFCGPGFGARAVPRAANLQGVANRVAGNVKEADQCSTEQEWPDVIGSGSLVKKPLGMDIRFGVIASAKRDLKIRTLACPLCEHIQSCPAGSTALRCEGCGGHWMIEAWERFNEKRTAKQKASAELEKITNGITETIKKALEADLREKYQKMASDALICDGTIIRLATKLKEQMERKTEKPQIVDRLQKARCCPICGTTEQPCIGPRTKYLCGTTTYDDRPGTFIIAVDCLERSSYQLGASSASQSTENKTQPSS